MRPPPLSRLTPDEILEQYQVDEDTMEEWSPKAWGKLPIPFADSRKLTVTEGKLLDELTSSSSARPSSGRARPTTTSSADPGA